MIANKEIYIDILNKKYNVLKKNLIIIEQDEDKIKKFENTIRELDKILNDDYKEKIESKKYLTTTLEDEYKRLYDYITIVEKRYKEREKYLNDYSNIIKQDLIGLEEIKEYQEIDKYNDRLELISNYLLNDEKYSSHKGELINLEDELSKEEKNMKEEKNELNEKELDLLVKLKELISDNVVYKDLNFDNIDSSIADSEVKVDEKEKELKIYLNSYNALLISGISDYDNEEYKSFINSLKDEYIDLLEKKYILKIYRDINNGDELKVIDTFNERIEKMNEFSLEDDKKFDSIFSMIKDYQKQVEEVEKDKMIINSINNNIEREKIKIDELLKELNTPEIKSLLKEFCIEKDYLANNDEENKKIEFNNNFFDELIISDLSLQKKEGESVKSEIKKVELKKDAIKEIIDNKLLSLENSRSKALNVMKKVCESLT